MVLARHVQQDAAVIGVRPVLDGEPGQAYAGLRRAKQLKERRAALGRRPVVEPVDDRLPVDGDGVRALGGARQRAIAQDENRLACPDLLVDAQYDVTRPSLTDRDPE